MEFGIFHEFPSLAGRPDEDAFDQAFDLVDTAERGGLDAVWLAELHFDPARSVLSAPLCVASAIAARTSRVKIGIAVQVLPLCHPLRLAEEAATVDQISRGRLILGVGRSGVAQTYEAYGVPYAESRDRFTETLDIIRQAWSGTDLSYDGVFHRFRNVTTTPRPYRGKLPDIRMAATSADTFPAIGRMGLPIFVGIRHEPASAVEGNIGLYREAYRAAGHPGEPRVFLRFPAYLARTDAQARKEAEPSLMHYYRAQAALLSESGRRLGGPAGDLRLAQARGLERITFEQALRGMVLIGSPETVARRLLGLRDELGLAGVLMELNAGGLTPHDQVKTALQLLCAEVMPHFGERRDAPVRLHDGFAAASRLGFRSLAAAPASNPIARAASLFAYQMRRPEREVSRNSQPQFSPRQTCTRPSAGEVSRSAAAQAILWLTASGSRGRQRQA